MWTPFACMLGTSCVRRLAGWRAGLGYKRWAGGELKISHAHIRTYARAHTQARKRQGQKNEISKLSYIEPLIESREISFFYGSLDAIWNQKPKKARPIQKTFWYKNIREMIKVIFRRRPAGCIHPTYKPLRGRGGSVRVGG